MGDLFADFVGYPIFGADGSTLLLIGTGRSVRDSFRDLESAWRRGSPMRRFNYLKTP
jgi:hypothetical protein